MRAKAAATLEIAGQTCPLSIEADWTLKGECPGLPLGTHAFTLTYRHSDFNVVIAEASGSLTLDATARTPLVIPALTKNQDDDADGHNNLSEIQFGTHPKDFASKPAAPAFSPLASFAVGSDPRAVAVARLNTDPVPDIVTANWADDTVTVRLGNSDGTLQAATTYQTGPVGGGPLNPLDLVLKDMDGDGARDIVVANSAEESGGAGSVAVLLGNGNGTFQTAKTTAVGNRPVALVLDDLNKDGFQDAVTGDFISENISILPGKGDGTFQTPVAPGSGLVGDVTALAVGDINSDTHLDIAASVLTSASVVIFLGDGAGGFQNPLTTPVGRIISLSLADLNGDPFLDLAATLAPDPSDPDPALIAVLIGNNNGTFQAPQFYKAGRSPGSMALQNLDSDGALDIVTENEGEGVVAVLRGNVDGSFQTPVFFEAGKQPGWVALGDLNGDGGFDFVLTDRASNQVSILLTK
ncbi:MAG: FG-GAP repeat domain-containing protein [Nitrospiria bacterium]